MLFQGQELLEDRWFDDTVALDWEKASTNRGILRLHRDLIALRRDRDGSTRGLRGPNVAILRADQEAKVLVMHRWMDGGPHDDTVVVANFADRTLDDVPIGFPAPGRWNVRFNSDASAYAPDFQGHDAFDLDADGPPLDGCAAERPALGRPVQRRDPLARGLRAATGPDPRPAMRIAPPRRCRVAGWLRCSRPPSVGHIRRGPDRPDGPIDRRAGRRERIHAGQPPFLVLGGLPGRPWAASSWSSTSAPWLRAVIVDVLRLWPLALVAIGLGLVLRRTRFRLPGGMLAAAAPGLLLGAGLAVAPRIAIDCGAATVAPTISQHQGQFDGPARVTVATGCGELVVGTAPGAAWQFDAGSIADRAPIVDASSRSLAISAGGDHGWHFAFDSDGIDDENLFERTRDTWRLTLPTTDIEDLSVT